MGPRGFHRGGKLNYLNMKVLGTFLFVLFIHIQVHKETQFTDNDVLGIAIIATALYFGRMSTPNSGGKII